MAPEAPRKQVAGPRAAARFGEARMVEGCNPAASQTPLSAHTFPPPADAHPAPRPVHTLPQSLCAALFAPGAISKQPSDRGNALASMRSPTERAAEMHLAVFTWRAPHIPHCRCSSIAGVLGRLS